MKADLTFRLTVISLSVLSTTMTALVMFSLYGARRLARLRFGGPGPN
jgi:hypothetical protein